MNSWTPILYMDVRRKKSLLICSPRLGGSPCDQIFWDKQIFEGPNVRTTTFMDICKKENLPLELAEKQVSIYFFGSDKGHSHPPQFKMLVTIVS